MIWANRFLRCVREGDQSNVRYGWKADIARGRCSKEVLFGRLSSMALSIYAILACHKNIASPQPKSWVARGMIAKRLVQALRRQDWTMIAIEFALVLVGVLLAFQINEWASQRARAGESQLAAERLLEELELGVAYHRQTVEYGNQIRDGLGFAIGRIVGNELQEVDEERIAVGLVKARAMVALAPPSSVYDDLVSSGDFNQIGSVSARAAISRYRASLSFEERMRQYLQVPLADYQRISAFRYEADPKGQEQIRLFVDFPALLRDRQAQQVIALTSENHRILLMLRTRALMDSERMCVALAASIGRSCNRNLPLPTYD